mgnify:CR=1 FL=1
MISALRASIRRAVLLGPSHQLAVQRVGDLIDVFRPGKECGGNGRLQKEVLALIFGLRSLAQALEPRQDEAQLLGELADKRSIGIVEGQPRVESKEEEVAARLRRARTSGRPGGSRRVGVGGRLYLRA